MKPNEPVLEVIEKKAQEIGRLVHGELPSGVGFCLTLFTFGDGGFMTYVSSAQRNDMIATLKEMIAKLEGTWEEDT